MKPLVRPVLKILLWEGEVSGEEVERIQAFQFSHAVQRGKLRLGKGMSQQGSRLGTSNVLSAFQQETDIPRPSSVGNGGVPSMPTASHCGGPPGAGTRVMEVLGSQSSFCRCRGLAATWASAATPEAAFPTCSLIPRHLGELCWNVTVLPWGAPELSQ